MGNITNAPVYVDGYELFSVATAAGTEQGEYGSLPAIEIRVQRIENALKFIVESGFNPKTLQVYPGTLNGETVILVSDGQKLAERVVGTITELDAQLYGQPISDLAKESSTIIRKALLKAQAERRSEFWQRQALVAGGIFLGTTSISLILFLFYKRVVKEGKKLHQQFLVLEQLSSSPDLLHSPTTRLSEPAPIKFLNRKLQQLSKERQLQINLLLRRLLFLGQFPLWGGGISVILTLFPYTRRWGVWLLGRPKLLLIVLFGIIVAKKASDFAIDFLVKSWIEQESLRSAASQRQALRMPTYSLALKGLASIFWGCSGIFFSLDLLGVPIGPILAGAGIIGVALSFGSQNLVQDVIRGCLILWADQFAVGDFIEVEEVGGQVEHMNLFLTQLRSLDGELITIPNGSIAIVRNLSKNWSRMSIGIEVAFDSDTDKVIQVMKEVAEKMYNDPEWRDYLLEPPPILGIDNLAHTGILIRAWVNTEPLQHLRCGREFRRRLKLAFEQQGIAIGIPQQSLWLKDTTKVAEDGKSNGR
ncbi:MAG: mechanosensitive ion channel family protein [Spirulinaceae cyanobacterium]